MWANRRLWSMLLGTMNRMDLVMGRPLPLADLDWFLILIQGKLGGHIVAPFPCPVDNLEFLAVCVLLYFICFHGLAQ